MRIPCSIKLVMSALGIAYPLLLLWEIAVLFSGYNIGHASALATTLVVQLLTFIALSLLVLYMPETSIFVCIFYLVVSLLNLGALLVSFAQVYAFGGLIDPEGKITRDPAECLYFSAITWTTVGYGDFRPTAANRSYAAIEALSGTVFLAIFNATLVRAASFPKLRGDSSVSR